MISTALRMGASGFAQLVATAWPGIHPLRRSASRSSCSAAGHSVASMPGRQVAPWLQPAARRLHSTAPATATAKVVPASEAFHGDARLLEPVRERNDRDVMSTTLDQKPDTSNAPCPAEGGGRQVDLDEILVLAPGLPVAGSHRHRRQPGVDVEVAQGEQVGVAAVAQLDRPEAPPQPSTAAAAATASRAESRLRLTEPLHPLPTSAGLSSAGRQTSRSRSPPFRLPSRRIRPRRSPRRFRRRARQSR